jgi:hypothetical protein
MTNNLEYNIIFPVLCYYVNVTNVDGCAVYYAVTNKAVI